MARTRQVRSEARTSAKQAAIEEERARQNLRELQRAGRETQVDRNRLDEAQRALDDARRR